MSKYEDPTQLDYRYGGDTVDDFAQKYMKTVAYIFSALNELRSPTGGTLTQNPEAYQLKVDDNKLYIRNQANTDWILLGDVKENFGFRTSASDAFMHESDVADSGKAGKLIRADASGKLNADILGNAAKIAGKAIQMGLDLADEDRLVYDKDTDTVTNRPLQVKVDGDKIYARKDATTDWILLGDLKQNLGFRSSTDDAFLTESDVADNGTAGKLIRADVNGKLNADILGNARKMAGKTFAPEDLQDGQIPVYRASDGTWHAENKGTVGTGKNLMIMDGDKMLGEYNGDEMKAIDIQKSSLTKALAETTGYGIVSGCEPSINGLTVTVANGVLHLSDGRRKEALGQTIVLNEPTTRCDLIYYDSNGNLQYQIGENGTGLVKSIKTVTMTTNAVTGDVLTFPYGITLTAGTDFAVGNTIEDTVSNIVAVIKKNQTLTDAYDITSAGTVITLTTENDGYSNGAVSTTGTVKVINTVEREGAAPSYIEPEMPSEALPVAKIIMIDGVAVLKDIRDIIPSNLIQAHNKSVFAKLLPYEKFTGVNGDAVTDKIDALNFYKYKKYGFSYTRTIIGWAQVEKTKGDYSADLSSWITYVRRASAVGIKSIITLAQTNSGDNAYTSYSDEWINAFATFAKTFVQKLKDAGLTGQIIELYNEPDLDSFWKSHKSDYAKLAKATYQAVKKIDSTAIIALPALAISAGESSLSWLANIGNAGALKYADVITIHPYNSSAPENMMDMLVSARKIVNRYGGNKVQIAFGECGYTTYTISDATTRANYMARIALIGLALNIKFCNYYTHTMYHDRSGGGNGFGLFLENGTPTESAVLLKSIEEELSGYAYAGIAYYSVNAYILAFVNKNGESKYIGWTSDTDGKIVDIDGQNIQLSETPSVVAIAADFFVNLSDLEPMQGLPNILSGNNAAIANSVVVGSNNKAYTAGIIVGDNNTVTGSGGIVAGYSSSVTAAGGIACGKTTVVSGTGAIGGGTNNTVSGTGAIVGGYNNTVPSFGAIVGGINNRSISHGGSAGAMIVGQNSLAANATTAHGVSVGAIPGITYLITSYKDSTLTLASTSGLSIGNTVYAFVLWDVPVECTISAIDTDANTITVNKTPNSSWYAISLPQDNKYGAFASGINSIAGEHGSSVLGSELISNTFYQMVIGQGNNVTNTGLFVIGNGDHSARSNAFRVTRAGAAYGQSAFNSTGADYAEYFEWADANTDNEDRIGYFATFDDGEKIRKATSADTYILGIVSGNASIIGNSYSDQWQGMYARDSFGRTTTEEYTVDEVKDENGIVIMPAHTETHLKLNPDYDASKTYESRENRAEWDAVGMVGVLPVRDDGTCKVNGYCKPNDSGVATSADTGYRVVARIADNIIKVLFR